MSMNVKVPLSTPIRVAGNEVTELDLRRPSAGELRGVKLLEVCQMETGAIIKVLARISTPMLSEQDAAGLDGADLMIIGTEIVAFFEPRATSSPVT
jgi:hypothetical protein